MKCIWPTKKSNFRKLCGRDAKFFVCWQHLWKPLLALSAVAAFLSNFSGFTGYTLKDFVLNKWHNKAEIQEPQNCRGDIEKLLKGLETAYKKRNHSLVEPYFANKDDATNFRDLWGEPRPPSEIKFKILSIAKCDEDEGVTETNIQIETKEYGKWKTVNNDYLIFNETDNDWKLIHPISLK